MTRFCFVARTCRWLPLLVLLVLSGCECGSTPNLPRACETRADCASDEICLDNRCAPRPDVMPDGGSEDGAVPMCVAPRRACGESCCEEGQRCGSDARCCTAEELCGGACCMGADRVCVADQCVLDCGEAAACGEGADAVCCGSGQVCLLGSCIDPGAPCEGAFDCPAGQYCDASVGRCLPRATDLPACEYRPRTGEFELQEKWHWSGDPDVVPTHNQVMSAPMVANLNDDNGDGRIDENDIPDVVFNSYAPASYQVNGVLRAISGADGSRLWPTAEPGYRTNPGLEVAIADIVPDSPGPEIVGCTFTPGTTSENGRLTIFSATGAILHRFAAAPASVGCGRPAIADMNGDGVAEIVVGLQIVQADGSGVVSAGLNATPAITALYDLDGDGNLDLVGINGAARHDGTVIWQAPLWAGHGGYVAVADMDLDGDPDVVATSTNAHQVTVRDGATGELLAGPIEITPSGDPVIDDRVAAIQRSQPDRDPLTGGGPPTIANFDDDPEPEFALAGGYAYVVFDHDGTRKWYYVTRDTSSRATGSSVFDFEGDGVAEVLYNDEYVFRAFRGPTGEIYLDRCNTSGTLTEYPIVVDVDNDDHADIVLVENNYSIRVCADGTPSTTGVRAFSHPANQWVRTRRIWNQHTYHVTNINEDGTLPTREEPNHLNPRLNNFRQNVQPDGLFDAPDLVLRDPSFATSACPSNLVLRVRVYNNGRAGAPAGVPVTFYVDGVAVGRVVTTRPLLPGASESVELRYGPVEGGAAYEVVMQLNDPEHDPLVGLNECLTDNNGTAPITAACPSLG